MTASAGRRVWGAPPRWAHLVVALLMVPLPVASGAQPGGAPPGGASADSTARAAPADTLPRDAAPDDFELAEARDLIKSGDYDRAVELLRGVIARTAGRPEEQREAYLQLIKTYVFLGNDYKFRPQGREASSLNYRAAREQIAECLAIPALRDTRPEPATDYPPEMLAFFTEVRGRMFGAFRVVGLDPPDALVVLGSDSVSVPAGEASPAVTLPVGAYAVTVRARGYQEMTETVTISPSATLERNYRLEKRRGPWWYATRITGAAGVVAGVVALVAGSSGSSSPSTPQPLPGAPPPP